MKTYKKRPPRRRQDDIRYWTDRYELIASKIKEVMRLDQSVIKGLNKGILNAEKTARDSITELDQEVETAEREIIRLGGTEGAALIEELKPDNRKEKRSARVS